MIMLHSSSLYRNIGLCRIIWKLFDVDFVRYILYIKSHTNTTTLERHISAPVHKRSSEIIWFTSALMNENDNVNGNGNDNRIQKQINATEYTHMRARRHTDTIPNNSVCFVWSALSLPSFLWWNGWSHSIYLFVYIVWMLSLLSFLFATFLSSSSFSSRIYIHICNAFISKWYVHSVEWNLLRLKSRWIRTMIRWCLNLIWFIHSLYFHSHSSLLDWSFLID